ncbi:hypothetical protein F6B41_34040 [Microbacterium lushaniae]|nr:hypothetical protein F6B41_34040 [Microbacterium lushaniae]
MLELLERLARPPGALGVTRHEWPTAFPGQAARERLLPGLRRRRRELAEQRDKPGLRHVQLDYLVPLGDLSAVLLEERRERRLAFDGHERWLLHVMRRGLALEDRRRQRRHARLAPDLLELPTDGRVRPRVDASPRLYRAAKRAMGPRHRAWHWERLLDRKGDAARFGRDGFVWHGLPVCGYRTDAVEQTLRHGAFMGLDFGFLALA